MFNAQLKHNITNATKSKYDISGELSMDDTTIKITYFGLDVSKNVMYCVNGVDNIPFFQLRNGGTLEGLDFSNIVLTSEMLDWYEHEKQHGISEEELAPIKDYVLIHIETKHRTKIELS